MSRRARPDQDANGHLRGSSPVPAKTGFGSGMAHRRGAEQGAYLLLNPSLLAHQDVPAALQHDCPHPRDPAS